MKQRGFPQWTLSLVPLVAFSCSGHAGTQEQVGYTTEAVGSGLFDSANALNQFPNVSGARDDRKRSSGTGSLVTSSFVLTANHLVTGETGGPFDPALAISNGINGELKVVFDLDSRNSSWRNI